MSRQKIEELGFDTWLELYETLKAANVHQHKEAALEWPGGTTEIVSLEHVRSRAFEEIYPILPQVGAIEVMASVIQDESIEKHRRLIGELLKKIPTRAND